MRGTSFFLLLTLFTLGCGRPLLSPAQGGGTWRELRSPRFVLRTDLDEAAATDHLTEFEQIYGAFEDIAYPHEPRPRGTIHVVLFARERDYEQLTSSTADAYFTTLTSDTERPPTLVLPRGLSDEVRALFQHELSHRFFAFYFPAAPTWMNEGMAEFYSTLRLDAGEAHLGEPLLDRFISTGQGWFTLPVRGREMLAVPQDALPSIDALRALDKPAFYADDADDPESLGARRRALTHYTAAWALVHLLQVGKPDLHARFLRYQQALTEATRDPADAWAAAFGDLPPGQLQQAFDAFVQSEEVPSVARPYTPRPPVTPALRPMHASEVHVLWARLRSWDTPEGLRAAGADIARALELAPTHPEPWLARATLRMRTGGRAGSIADLRRAVELAPTDPRYLHPLASMLTLAELDLPEGARVWDDITPLVRRLERHARATMQLNFLGAYYTVRRRYARALTYIERAIASQASCDICYGTLAELFSAQERFAEAIQAQKIALNLTPEHQRDTKQSLLARLREYEQALAAARKGAAEAETPAP